MGDDQTYDIDELAALAGMTARNVRAYRTRGLLQAPRRRGRSACYDDAHLERLRDIQRLRDAGIPLRLITDLARQGSDLGPDSRLGRLAQERLSERTLDLRDPPGLVDLTADGWVPLEPPMAEHLTGEPELHTLLVRLGVLAVLDDGLRCPPGVTMSLRLCSEEGLPPPAALRVLAAAADHGDRLAGAVAGVVREAGGPVSAELRAGVVRLVSDVAGGSVARELQPAGPA